MTNASEELAASVFEGRTFLCNLATVYQNSRRHILEDRVVNTQQPMGVLHPTPGLISKVQKVTVHHLCQKIKGKVIPLQARCGPEGG